jgi:hypothetical protein
MVVSARIMWLHTIGRKREIWMCEMFCRIVEYVGERAGRINQVNTV